MRFPVVVVLVLVLVTGVKQSQLLFLDLSLEFDNKKIFNLGVVWESIRLIIIVTVNWEVRVDMYFCFYQ